MTDAERARRSRARRSDAAERVEITFWPLLEVNGALATMYLHIKDHPGAAAVELQQWLEEAMDAVELISIALRDGSQYGRRKRFYVERHGYVNFHSQAVIDRMIADHMKRLEKIAARTGARFIRKDAARARARVAAADQPETNQAEDGRAR